MREWSGNGGLSLIEVVISGALMSIVFFVIVSLFPSSMVALRKGHDTVVAATIGQQQMERIRSLAFDAVAPGDTTDSLTVDDRTYTIDTRVTSLSTRLKGVRVVVSAPQSGAMAATTVAYESRIYNFTNP